MSSALIQLVRDNFPTAVVGSHENQGDACVLLGPDKLVEVCTFLRDDPRAAFDMLVMVTAADYLDFPAEYRAVASPVDEDNAYGVRADNMPRYEAVYALLSLTKRHRLRIKVAVDGPEPSVPSLCDVWPAANWGEREAWDMVGIKFENHPDLRRILLYEEFEGHPLRKDYDLRGYQPLIDMPHLAEYADHARHR